MRVSRWKMVGVYALTMAILVAGLVVLEQDRSNEGGGSTATASELPDLAPMPFPAAVSVDGSSRGVVGTQFGVSVTGYSENAVARVELYDGARLVSSGSPTAGSSTASLQFPALSVGPHALYAEVIDAEGRVSKTPTTVVDVSVAAPPGTVTKVDEQRNPIALTEPADDEVPPIQVPVGVEEGETVTAVAKRLGMTAAQVTVIQQLRVDGLEPPDLGPDDVIPVDAQAVVAVAHDAGIGRLTAPDLVVDNSPIGTTAVMGLSGKADGCDVVLTSSGGDGQVFYFDGNDGPSGWVEVGETAGDGDLRVVAPSPGVHVYFARTAERTSGAVSVTVPVTCGGDLGWTGEARIVDGELTLPAAAIGKVYLYLQVDGKTGVRIPAQQDSAIVAGYATSIKDQLPDLGSLAGTSAELSVWRYSEFPQEVATGSLKVPEGRTLVEIVGEPGSIVLSSSVPESANPLSTPTGVSLFREDEELTFDWTAASDRVDEVLWQVMQTAPTGNNPLAAPTVLAAGISAAAVDDDGSGKTGTFTVDTATIPGHGEVGAIPPLVGALTHVESAVTPATLVSLKAPKVVSPVDPTTEFDDRLQQFLELPGPGATLYVQVTANPKGPGPGTSSNVVTVELPTPEPPPPPDSLENGITMKVDSLTLDAGRVPSSEWVGCAEIVLPAYYGQRPLDDKYPRNAAHQYYDEGDGIYCYVPPLPPDPDDCLADVIPVVGQYACEVAELLDAIEDALVSALKSAYGVASKIYNGAIDGIVTLASKFNPVCIAAGQASKDAKAKCEELTAKVAGAVIGAVLASFGLPPKLPSLAELEALGRGELSALAVALMKQAGVPCDSFKASPAVVAATEESGATVQGIDVAEVIADPCLALATALVKQATKSITNGVSTTTAAATRLQDFSHLPGFSMKPVRESLPVPMQVRLTASPVDPETDATGLRCALFLVPSAAALGGFPHPFRSQPAEYLVVTEDQPIDGKGSFSGTAAMSNYFVGPSVATPLSTRLNNLDVTVRAYQVDFVPGYAKANNLSFCRDADAEVTARVGPPE